MRNLTITTLTILVSLASFGEDSHYGCKFFPDEVVAHYHPPSFFQGGLSEDDFKQVMGQIDQAYSEEFAAHGAELVLAQNKKSTKPNAIATRRGNQWYVVIHKALYAHPKMTADGLALVACHEVGHHIGGAPKKAGTWASAESQADYFGTLKCFRKLYQQEDNSKYVDQIDNKEIKEQCHTLYGHESKSSLGLCMRAFQAAQTLTNFLSEITRGQPAKVDRQDRQRVAQTNDGYPSIQCRLDTYKAGALCKVDKNEQISNSDPHIGTCSRKFGSQLGTRPLCWFNPEAS